MWAAFITVAIWSTLGLAGRLAEELRESNLLVIGFIAGFLLAVTAIVGLAVGTRPGKREFWLWIGVATAYGMVVVRMGIPIEERTHLFEYGLVAALVYRALRERMPGRGRVLTPAVLAVAITAGLGLVDESLQMLIPIRVFDLRDVAVNLLAGLMAVTASVVLERLNRIP